MGTNPAANICEKSTGFFFTCRIGVGTFREVKDPWTSSTTGSHSQNIVKSLLMSKEAVSSILMPMAFEWGVQQSHRPFSQQPYWYETIRLTQLLPVILIKFPFLLCAPITVKPAWYLPELQSPFSFSPIYICEASLCWKENQISKRCCWVNYKSNIVTS